MVATGQTMNRIDIEGAAIAAGSRLDWARGQLAIRTPAGPALEVHIHSGLAALLTDDDNFVAVHSLVAHGETANVVVFLHGDLDEITTVLSARSTRLASELVAGRTLRHVPPRTEATATDHTKEA